AEALESARKAADGQDLRLGGGATVIRDFLAAGLVDHMHIVVVPILLGRGARLWEGLEGLEKGYQVEAASSPSGVTHMTFSHFAHCGGNRLFPGVPIHVQARELADARSLDDYTIREWVDFDGATYVEHEGEVELLPGIRLLPAPGHTDGHQVVVVETGAGTNVLGGDVGVWFGELGSGTTEGQRRVLALRAPTWLSHAPGPKIPEHRP